MNYSGLYLTKLINLTHCTNEKATLLHYLRTKRFTLGRGVLAIVASTWLLLAFQSCVVAATPDMAGCGAMAASVNGHDGHQGNAGNARDIAEPDCCPPVVCQALATADYKAVDLGGGVQWQLDVLAPAPLPPHTPVTGSAKASRLGAYQAEYLPPHPTVRFCVLRI